MVSHILLSPKRIVPGLELATVHTMNSIMVVKNLSPEMSYIF